jgi:hypothetical protein
LVTTRLLFKNEADVIVWNGEPDCQSGHQAILDELTHIGAPFDPSYTELTNPHKGNIGEFISMILGKRHRFASYRVYAANAFNPLSRISRSEMDLLWLFLGTTTADDLIILQEVKTTGSPEARLSQELITDYKKLFSTNTATTLNARLQGVKNNLEYQENRPDLCSRINKFLAATPANCAKARIIPTLVHEKEKCDAVTRMLAIKATLEQEGWNYDNIEAWAIGLSDLDNRLLRLVKGQP